MKKPKLKLNKWSAIGLGAALLSFAASLVSGKAGKEEQKRLISEAVTKEIDKRVSSSSGRYSFK